VMMVKAVMITGRTRRCMDGLTLLDWTQLLHRP
jgi:hypothetical protein